MMNRDGSAYANNLEELGSSLDLGRITGIQSGSLQNLSYTWDHLGNLTYRSDSLTSGNVSESFGYDILNRLLSAQVTNGSGVQPALSYSYDALGNITGKSDTGSYTYGATRPHAVTSIAGPQGGSYSYDANGNMTNRNGTTITWNSDNMPTTITQNGSNSSSFSYAPDKNRYYQTAMIAGVSETTVYVGGYEAVTTGGITKYRHHLMADGREVAEVDLWVTSSTTHENVSYIFSDHLGSVDVVQTTNASGAVISTTPMSFSAWGNRREPGSWLPPVGAAETQADHNANRYGFTHQEMLDNVNLIHMNGRIYDPNLGRFLSVDPVFQFPTNTQSLNPYTYVLNNPLSLTDPTGYVVSGCPTGSTTCPQDISNIQLKDVTSIQKNPNGQLVVNTKDASYAVDSLSSSGSAVGSHIVQTTTTSFNGSGYSTNISNGGQLSRGGEGTNVISSSGSGGSGTGETGVPQATKQITPANAVTGTQTQTKNDLAQQQMSVSQQGQDFIKGYEKLSLTVYDAHSPHGDWTIGYGHKVASSDFGPISEEQAQEFFSQDLSNIAAHVNADLHARVTQNQFDALVSLRFNAGANVITPPVSDLNRTGHATMEDFTNHYITAGGVKMKGLETRRAAEWRIFSQGVYDDTH